MKKVSFIAKFMIATAIGVLLMAEQREVANKQASIANFCAEPSSDGKLKLACISYGATDAKPMPPRG